ncbi:MAG: hypothetical protein ACE5EY_14310 [Anaerolineae bacterium]
MNNLHPDVQYQIHRSYQKERLEKSLQEKPENPRRTIRPSTGLISLGIIVALIGGYVVLM